MMPADHPSLTTEAELSPDQEKRDRAWNLVLEVIELWGRGVPADAQAFLARHPELASDKTFVLELAYEEYCLRLETGQPLDRDEFVQRFPNYQASLRKLLAAHSFHEGRSEPGRDLNPVPWFKPGTELHGFHLLRELGKGTFARVYLAREIALGDRLVAVKVCDRGEKEAQLLGPLSHPHIVPVHSVHRDPVSGFTLICMPYHGAATLCDLLDRAFRTGDRPSRGRVILEACRPSGPEELASSKEPPDSSLTEGSYIEGILHLTIPIAEALDFVHRKGICHRDLKPSNVLLRPWGQPMLLDFNLSVDCQTPSWNPAGTVPYMAPEQLGGLIAKGTRGSFPAATPRSDLYSLGVIVYELLSGKGPFGPIDEQQPVREYATILLAEQRKGPRPLREAAPGVNGELVRLVERCLAFDPDRRPSSAAEVAAGLRKQLARLQWRRRWLTRRTVVVSLAGAVLLTLGLGIAGRSPSVEELLQRGWERYQEKDYQGAEEHFHRATQADPQSSAAWFARGRALQQLGDFDQALESFLHADRLGRSPQIVACLGYCFSRLNRHQDALWYHSEAIRRGWKSAELYNNRGYNLMELGQHEWARKELTEAIQLNKSLQAPRHLRALVDLHKATSNAHYLPQSGIEDVEIALRLGPASAELHWNAACLYALAVRQESRFLKQALEHAHQAVKMGADPGKLAKERALQTIAEEPQIQALSRQSPSLPPPARPNFLLDPVSDSVR